MPGTKHADTPSYQQPFVSEPQPQLPQYVIALPCYAPPGRHHLFRKPRKHPLTCFLISFLFLFLVGGAYVLWPSDPELSIVHVRLDHIHILTRPIALDVKLDLTFRVQNRDFYSVKYGNLTVQIGYRGNKLGFATSDGGRISARGTSCVNATLQLDGVEVLSDVILLIEDLARGAIAFDTVSEISGKLGLGLFDFPLKAKISCEVIVNMRNQTTSHQNCYPLLSQERLGGADTCIPPINQLTETA